MKKLLLSAFLGLAALASAPSLSQAGTFGLFTNCGCGWFGCCGCSCNCNFTVRPYNAFTPVCAGNITCMGCMPFAPYPNYSGLGYGCPMPGYPQPPVGYESPAPSYLPQQEIISDSVGGPCDSSCADAAPLPSSPTPALPPLPLGNMQQPAAKPAPMLPPPVPVPLSPLPGMSYMTPNPNGMIQAGYRVMYPQPYNPYGYYGYGTMGAAPYYWNGK